MDYGTLFTAEKYLVQALKAEYARIKVGIEKAFFMEDFLRDFNNPGNNFINHDIMFDKMFYLWRMRGFKDTPA